MFRTQFIVPVEGEPKIIEVPEDYKTIQAAINAANPGDIIQVAPGTYNECVTVNKPLTLIGENNSTTIISSNGTYHVIYVTANHVNISEFTIRDGIQEVDGVWHYFDGIWLQESNGTNISGNIITNNFQGIILQSCSDTKINNNLIINNQDGVGSSSSDRNIISNNTISNNLFSGITLQADSDENIISGNTVSDNKNGIYILGCCDNNAVYHNNLINNTYQASSEKVNTWDDGYPSGGNYWSDYKGTDLYSGPYQNETGSDGIGDTPYPINNDNRDMYPLMYQWPDITPPTTTDNYDGLWHTANFTVTLTAKDDKSGVKATYYKINDSPTKTVSTDGQPLITTERADNKLEYWSIDNIGNKEIPHHILTDIKLDKTAPSGSITINNGDAYTTSTTVTLTLTATDTTSGVYQVRFSNDGVWDTEPWQPYTTPKAWNLTTGDGTKTVYYQIKDNAGLKSQTYSDSIVLDTTKPSIGTPSQNPPENMVQPNQKVTVSVEVTDGQSGVREVILYYRCSTDGGQTWTIWANVQMNKTTGNTYKGEIPGFIDGTRVQYSITAHDNAGNTATKDNVGQYYVYTVIPEFPTWTAILAALCILLIGLPLLRRNYTRRRIPQGLKP